jgi:DNA-binding IclR family transcriptional regulator
MTGGEPTKVTTSHIAHTVVDRGLLILDASPPGAAELSLTDISRRTGLPIATTHRLLSQIQRSAALERVPNDKYQIQIRLRQAAQLFAGADHEEAS